MAKNFLPRLIRHRRHILDEKRQKLAALEGQKIAYENDLQLLAQEVTAEMSVAQRSFSSECVMPAYLAESARRKEQILARIQEVRGLIQEALADLQEHFQKVKALEIVQDQHLEQEKTDRDQKEQAFLDEVGARIEGGDVSRSPQ